MMSNSNVSVCLKLVGVFLISATLAFDAVAQSFPNRPITAIWPFAAGSTTEAGFRAMYAEASKLLGQPVLFEPRPGAGGRLGILAVGRAPADGYMLSIGNEAALAVLAQYSDSFKVRPVKDYAPVQKTVSFFHVVTAHPSVPFRDLKGLIAYAKANPGKLNYGSSGVGGTHHLYWEQLMAAASIELTQISYKGGAQVVPEIIAGRVQLFSWLPGDLKRYIDSGHLVAIATTGPNRLLEFPNIPTLREQGLSLTLGSWVGIVASPGTPASIVSKLNEAFNSALKVPLVAKLFADSGYYPAGGTPDEFTAQINSDIKTYQPLVQRLGLKSD